jgi:uncharacterized membrane protein
MRSNPRQAIRVRQRAASNDLSIQQSNITSEENPAMNMKNLALAAAVGSLLSMSATTTAFAGEKAADKEKCYGVAMAGKNDCAANGHSCAGQSKIDKDPTEWKYVPKGECEKMGGTTTAGKKM